MLPDWVSNPGPLTYESGALLIALRGPALHCCMFVVNEYNFNVCMEFTGRQTFRQL